MAWTGARSCRSPGAPGPRRPRRTGRRTAPAAAFLLLAACLPARAAGDEAPTRATEAFEREIAAIEAEMEQIRGEEGALSVEMQSLSAEEGIARRRLAIAREEKERLSSQVAEQESRRAEIQEALERTRRAAEEALREIYKQGRMKGYDSVLSVESPTDILRGIQHLDAVARRQRDAITAYIDEKEASEALTRDLETRRASLEVAIARAGRAADGYAAQRRRRQGMLDHLAEDKATHQRAAEELRRAAEELSAAIEALPPGAPVPGVTTDFSLLEGSLPWPAHGPVTVGFGRIRNRRFGTLTPHTGLDIEAGPGGPVLAVAAGRVLFSRRYGAYGRTVVIDHGARYLSVYAKLAAATVQENDSVLPGQEIGFAEEGDGNNKSSIYFEIRYQGKPLDPGRWLRRAR